MSEQDGWRISWSDAVKTPSSVAAYADDRFTFEKHLLDWLRTRIKPGADPRAEWSRRDGPWKSRLFAHPDDTGIEQRPPRDVRKFTREQRDTLRRLGRNYRRWSVFEQPSELGGITWAVEQWCVRTRATYVPRDVSRWRDPEHREALKRRARARAALVPGNRATMEVER